MANQENVKRAIAVMENVPYGKFDIRNWFGECGTVACFAGHLALSPDIPEITYKEFNQYLEEEVAKFLDIRHDQAYNLCGLNNSIVNDHDDEFYGEMYDEFYMDYSHQVTSQDVVAKLKAYLVEDE